MRSLVLHWWNFWCSSTSIQVWVVLLTEKHLRKSIVGHACVGLSLVIETRTFFGNHECTGLLRGKTVLALHLRHFRRSRYASTKHLFLALITTWAHWLRLDPLLLYGFETRRRLNTTPSLVHTSLRWVILWKHGHACTIHIKCSTRLVLKKGRLSLE